MGWDTVEVKCAFAMYVVVADGRVTDAPNRAPLSVLCGDLLLGWGAGDLGIQWSPPGLVDNGRMQLHRKLLGHLRLETPPALRGESRTPLCRISSHLLLEVLG